MVKAEVVMEVKAAYQMDVTVRVKLASVVSAVELKQGSYRQHHLKELHAESPTRIRCWI